VVRPLRFLGGRPIVGRHRADEERNQRLIAAQPAGRATPPCSPLPFVSCWHVLLTSSA
jgi:hypothetical protein